MARTTLILFAMVCAGCTQRIGVLSGKEEVVTPAPRGDGGIIREPDNFDPLYPDSGDGDGDGDGDAPPIDAGEIPNACGVCPAGELCAMDVCVPAAQISALSVTFAHTCAITAGRLFCWGANDAGQLGLGDREPRSRRTRVGANSDWLAIATGDKHTCGLRAPGMLVCWGDNAYGQLATGDTDPRIEPTISPSARAFRSVECGSNSCCALDSQDQLICWGDNFEGKIGLNDEYGSADVLFPAQSGTSKYARVAVGQGHVCAIDLEGALFCWGRNTTSELGVGPEPIQARQALRVGDKSDWHDITASQHSTCGVRSDGSLWCWGLNLFHELSRPELDTEFDVPMQVGADLDWAHVRAGWFHTCGTKTTGKLFCWGRSIEGQLGQGGGEPPIEQPVMVAEPPLYSQLALGNFFTCAVTPAAQLHCWGENSMGQLGLGDFDRRFFPEAVP